MAWKARTARLVGLALALGLAGPAIALDPCEALVVPEGYRLVCETEGGTDPPERTATVVPIDTRMPTLNRILVERVGEPVEEPEAWMRAQVAVDVSALQDAARSVAEGPLGGTAIGEALARLVDRAGALGELPLLGCEEPRARVVAGRRVHEMRCSWGAAPVEQHLVLRLVEHEGERFALRIRATDDERLRQFLAIAGSFSRR